MLDIFSELRHYISAVNARECVSEYGGEAITQTKFSLLTNRFR